MFTSVPWTFLSCSLMSLSVSQILPSLRKCQKVGLLEGVLSWYAEGRREKGERLALLWWWVMSDVYPPLKVWADWTGGWFKHRAQSSLRVTFMLKFVAVVLLIFNDTSISSDTQIKLNEQRLIHQPWKFLEKLAAVKHMWIAILKCM